MKIKTENMKNKIITLIVVLNITLMSSCIKEKYKEPSQVIPHVGYTANLTIAQLKATYSTGLVYIGDTLPGTTITQPIIQGIVNSTDESGNIYKTIYIQDNTGGIQLAVDRTSLYINFKVGQRVFVKLSGLYLGNYGGIIQVGYIYGNAPYPESIGRIPDVLIDSHILRDSLPGPAPTPVLKAIGAFSPTEYSMLVKIQKVHFGMVGSVYSTTLATTDRAIYDSTGTDSMVVRTSNYASFRNNLLPAGQGSLVGVLSNYNGTNQLFIRDMNDIQDWDPTALFPINIIDESFATSLGSFTQYSVTGAQVWTNTSHSGTTYANMSGYSGSNLANEDWLISSSLNFDNYSLETLNFRTAMNYGTAGDGSLKVYTSNNYSGTGDPNLATWNEISPVTLSTGSWSWISSGQIDLSGITGTNVHIAFKYISTTSSAATWEVTSVKLSAKPNQ